MQSLKTGISELYPSKHISSSILTWSITALFEDFLRIFKSLISMSGNVTDMNLKMEQEGVLRVRIPQCLVLDLSPLGHSKDIQNTITD